MMISGLSIPCRPRDASKMVEVNLTLEQAMKAQRGSRSIDLLFL
jgi:hypothetical protein